MTDALSREQIEHYRTTGQYPAGMMGATFRTLICDMALRSLDAGAVREAIIQEVNRLVPPSQMGLRARLKQAILDLGQINAAPQDDSLKCFPAGRAEDSPSGAAPDVREFAEALYGGFIRLVSGEAFCVHCDVQVDIGKWTTAVHADDCIINKAAALLARPAAAGVSEERSAQQQLNAIVDYIMGYWPISFAYVNPMQAIQVMVWRMVKAERALAERAGWVSEEDKL
jgi:hypothetical protein